MKILAFGEILWDIINGEEHLGGAPFNFAAHAAKCGNESFIISRLGDDFRGIKAFNKCKEYGVNNTLIQWDESHPTGIVDVVLDKGQPDYTIIENVAYDFIQADASLAKLGKNKFDVFYFGTLIQRNSVSAKTLRYILETFSFHNIFYDVNLRKGGYNNDTIHESMKACTILKMNIDEVPVISSMLIGEVLGNEEFCKAICAIYPQIDTVVITASDKGCYIYHNSTFEYITGKKVEVNDAVGAGDAFSAAFMHVFSREKNAAAAARIANELGAFVTTQRGAIPDYSSEIKSLLKAGTKSANYGAKIIL